MIRNFPALLLIITLFSFCTKTKERIIDKEADPVYDTLTQTNGPVVDYKIKTSDEDGIYANVDNTGGKITVYLPYHYQLQFMEPDITMASGFTITPKDELIPVLSTEPFVYTVKDSVGNTRNYAVDVVVQQPDMTIAELSTASNTVTVNPDGVSIAGRNMVPSFNVTTLYIMNSNGEEVGFLIGNADLNIPKSYSLTFSKFGGDISKLSPDTDYWIEIRSYTIIKRMQYPVRFAL